MTTQTNGAYLLFDSEEVDKDDADITTLPYCGFHKEAILHSTEEDEIIEVGEDVVWEFRIWVTNLYSWTMENVVVTDRLGAELEIDDVLFITPSTSLYI